MQLRNGEALARAGTGDEKGTELLQTHQPAGELYHMMLQEQQCDIHPLSQHILQGKSYPHGRKVLGYPQAKLQLEMARRERNC